MISPGEPIKLQRGQAPLRPSGMIALQKLTLLKTLSVRSAPVKSAPVKSAREKSLPISVEFLKLTRLKDALVKSENFKVASEKSEVSNSESIAEDLEIEA